jgi:acetyl-CoA decarbonylase/synthase complex subunit gamma
MALTGLQIFKHLPGGKKEKEANCKKCGFPTCMAFAMKLAKNEVDYNKCEYISSELKEMLDEASIPQQQEIKFGQPDNPVIVGNETVMFRHDKTFVNPTCLAIRLESTDKDFNNKLSKISNYTVERVGENLKVDALVVIDKDDTFEQKAMLVANTGLAIILESSSLDKTKETLSSIKNNCPLVYLKTDDTSILTQVAKEFNVPVIISGDNIENLINSSEEMLNSKIENLILKLDKKENIIEDLTYIRRSAIENKFRPLGFPTVTFVSEIADTDNEIEKAIFASALMCKYSNIIVLDEFDEALIYSLLTLRQNIFTDPQKPLQIEPKLYPIGDVTENSPILITTNFALTYFVVASEIESTGIPAYLLVTPSDGMSVLTAWAASKFTGESIAKALKNAEGDILANHRKIIIPGYVENLKEELEEELPDWEVVIGPYEASELPEYLRNYVESNLQKNQL